MSWIIKKEKAERREKLIADAGAILKTAHAESREMTPDENRQFEEMHADADRLCAEIETINKQEQAERSVEQRIGRDVLDAPKAERSKEQESRAFRKWIVSGTDALNPEERAAFAGYTLEQRVASGMSASTSGAGAEFVPQSFADRFFSKLKYYGGVRQAGATMFTTQGGNPFPVPLLDDVSHSGELLSENAAVADDATNDPDTSNITLGAYIFSSKVVRVPLTLVQDTAFPVEDWLAGALAERIGRAQNTYFTTGTGSSQPKGVVTASSLGKTTAATNAVTYPEILDFFHSLDPAYRPNAKLMCHDSFILAMKKLVDDNSRPLWDGGNIALATPATINGVPYIVNNDMAELSSGVSSKCALYGDFSRFLVRDVIGIEMARLDQPYMPYLQIGYISWLRSDSNCIDPTAIKHLKTAAS